MYGYRQGLSLAQIKCVLIAVTKSFDCTSNALTFGEDLPKCNAARARLHTKQGKRKGKQQRSYNTKKKHTKTKKIFFHLVKETQRKQVSMGCCASSSSDEEKPRGKKGTESMQRENVKKLLFLGPGGCGKSTLFKQLRQTFGEDIEKEERVLFHDHIWSFIIETVQCVLGLIGGKSELSEQAQGAYEIMLNVDAKSRIDMDMAAQIKLLWKEDVFKEVFEEE
ncbi:hypothetical protein RFI_08919, partial [Reticulomyxa filosa]